MRTETLDRDTEIKSGFLKILSYYIHDWLVILFLAIIDGILRVIHPFHRFVGESVIGDFMYPLNRSTIPLHIVPVIALVIPISVFLAYYFLSKRVNADLHHAILGLFFTVAITAVITDAIKDAIGQPRPDFYWRCFPNGKPRYDTYTHEVICNGNPLLIKEGHKSFPSGYTSWCFSGLGFMSLYIAGKVQIFDQRGHIGKTALVISPVLGALLVGFSRVHDYWNRWQDVFAGGLLGSIMAILCYHQFFPPIHHERSMEPFFQINMNENAPSIFGCRAFYGRSVRPPLNDSQLRNSTTRRGIP